MATASAMGRPLASRPSDHRFEPWMCSRCIHRPFSDGMTTNTTTTTTRRNHQANLSHHHHHHHYRRASTVQTTMEELSTDMRTGVWTSPEPPDPTLSTWIS
ncbi:hypothetical protein EPR50_G00012700 [Xyrichtys novacula]|uniref:Uncharacterized protein n=1 Tax=Xyrichtys novacula TaxID=13765 RepID=A0AAV1EYZ4_XYRNO|nr:hypothetical protein EPR50_G00012700 [Xyrichtys novacula]